VTEPTAVRVRVHADNGGAGLLIEVDGAIDLSSAPAVESEILGAISNQATSVTVDLSSVDYLDSAGLRVVFALATRLAELRTELVIAAPIGSISRRVLDLSGFSAIGTLRP
jgi:anti-anti-sigma factor